MKRLSVYQHGTKIFQDESEYYKFFIQTNGCLQITNTEGDTFYISAFDTYKIEEIEENGAF
jgi:hypothetical protein